MKKKMVACLVLMIVLFGLIAGRVNERYVSGWMLVEGNTQETFVHGLGGRPLEVQAWAGLPVSSTGMVTSCQADFQAVIPAESRGIVILMVGADVIMVENTGDMPVCVQIVGRR